MLFFPLKASWHLLQELDSNNSLNIKAVCVEFWKGLQGSLHIEYQYMDRHMFSKLHEADLLRKYMYLVITP